LWSKDLYTKCQLRCDISILSFKDCSVDEIVQFHVIEHLKRGKAVEGIQEWYRVLKYGGKMIIECPDFERTIQEYLEGNLDRVFNVYGHDTNGMHHYFGYSKESLKKDLEWIGFEITFIGEGTDYHSKEEPCLRIEAIKNFEKLEKEGNKYQMNKTIAIMTGAFVPENRQVTLFKHLELIKQLPDNFLKVLISHTALHQNVQKYVDIYLYDKNNVIDSNRQFSFGCAESYLIRQGLILSKFYNIKYMYKLGFDVLPDNIFEIYNWIKYIDDGYKMVTFKHGESGVGTLCFLVNVEWGLENLPCFRTVDKMFNGIEGKHLEVAYGEKIIENNNMDKVYFYDNPNKMFNQKIGNVDFNDDCQGVKQDKKLLSKYKVNR
jgi:hypothetical protein